MQGWRVGRLHFKRWKFSHLIQWAHRVAYFRSSRQSQQTTRLLLLRIRGRARFIILGSNARYSACRPVFWAWAFSGLASHICRQKLLLARSGAPLRLDRRKLDLEEYWDQLRLPCRRNIHGWRLSYRWKYFHSGLVSLHCTVHGGCKLSRSLSV